MPQRVAGPDRQFKREFDEGPGLVKPDVVANMLQDPAGHRGHERIPVGGPRPNVLRAEPHSAVGHGEPIGDGGPGREVRLVEERQSMGEVVHVGKKNCCPPAEEQQSVGGFESP